MRISGFAATIALLAGLVAAPALANEGADYPKLNWSFNGPFGTIDQASAQRGFQVYKEVCSACHSIKQAYYRDLKGIGLSDKDVAAIASTVSIPALGDDGSAVERPGLASDHFKSPFANDRAARAANNGALPPDFSVIVKAREGGADYLHALLGGYSEPPAGMKLGSGMYYNHAFPGGQIGMPAPLSEGRVTYADGTPASVDQMSKDVAQFLTYIANPEMDTRKRTGVKMVLFLLLLTGVTYAVKRRVWSDVEH